MCIRDSYFNGCDDVFVTENDAETPTVFSGDAGANCTTNDGGFPAYDHTYILVYAGWCGDLFCYKYGAINHSPSLNTWARRKYKWLIQYTL